MKLPTSKDLDALYKNFKTTGADKRMSFAEYVDKTLTPKEKAAPHGKSTAGRRIHTNSK